MKWKFKDEKPFERRKEESERIRNKFPDRVPIILEKGNYSLTNLGDLEQKKFLVPNDITIGQFSFLIRKRLKIKNDEYLFILIDKIQSPPESFSTMGELYKKYADEDKFLYLIYTGETFVA